jgi:hypothetical protein
MQMGLGMTRRESVFLRSRRVGPLPDLLETGVELGEILN